MTTIKINGRDVEVRETLADRVVAWLAARRPRPHARPLHDGDRDRRGRRLQRRPPRSPQPPLMAAARGLGERRHSPRPSRSPRPLARPGAQRPGRRRRDRDRRHQRRRRGPHGHAGRRSHRAQPSDQQAEDFESAARAEWRMWCDCADFTKTQSFGEMQALAFRSVLESGDALAVRRYRKDAGDAYGLKILLLEADRVSNPRPRADAVGMIGGVAVQRRRRRHRLLGFQPAPRRSRAIPAAPSSGRTRRRATPTAGRWCCTFSSACGPTRRAACRSWRRSSRSSPSSPNTPTPRRPRRSCRRCSPRSSPTPTAAMRRARSIGRATPATRPMRCASATARSSTSPAARTCVRQPGAA
jgi:hypothetical protein